MPSPNPGIIHLTSVTAVSAADAWAVGNITNGANPPRTLILHWNGKRWKQVPSPTPAGSTAAALLFGVAATSGRNAWAVGYDGNSHNNLILHWNGKRWTQVPSPNPGAAYNQLNAVAAVSATDAWAVGAFVDNASEGPTKTLIEHWNGTRWTQVPSPVAEAGESGLTAVSATSGGNAWAVGSDGVIEHWNGTRWKVVPGAGPQGTPLSGVTAISARDAWAVGKPDAPSVLIEHWNGTKWTRVPGPRLGLGSGEEAPLYGVAASASRGRVWAVGARVNNNEGGTVTALTLYHC